MLPTRYIQPIQPRLFVVETEYVASPRTAGITFSKNGMAFPSLPSQGKYTLEFK